MSTYIYGVKSQTAQEPVWDNPQGCACGDCSAFSWRNDCPADTYYVGVVDCCVTCPSKRVCTYANIGECNIGKSKRGYDPVVSVNWYDVKPQIQCKYNLNMIDTITQLEAFRSMYGETEDFKHGVIKYCSGQATSMCPPDPYTGLPQYACSKLTTNGEDGIWCRNYVFKYPEMYDNISLTYCANYDTTDCECINRTSSPTYIAMKPANPIPDSCWWTACSNKGKFLVPSDLLNPDCPDNMCQQFFQVEDVGGNVDVSDLNNTINCTFIDNGDEVDVYEPGQEPNPNPNDESTYSLVYSNIQPFISEVDCNSKITNCKAGYYGYDDHDPFKSKPACWRNNDNKYYPMCRLSTGKIINSEYADKMFEDFGNNDYSSYAYEEVMASYCATDPTHKACITYLPSEPEDESWFQKHWPQLAVVAMLSMIYLAVVTNAPEPIPATTQNVE